MLNNFTKKILYLYLVVYFILFILHYTDVISQLFIISSIYAGLINLINAFAAVKLFNISYKSGASTFMIYNLGGMGIRLFSILIMFVLVIKILNVDKYGFILVFFLFYFISLVFEVIFYLKTVKKIS